MEASQAVVYNYYTLFDLEKNNETSGSLFHSPSLMVIWRNQGITNKKSKESDALCSSVSHAGERKKMSVSAIREK